MRGHADKIALRSRVWATEVLFRPKVFNVGKVGLGRTPAWALPSMAHCGPHAAPSAGKPKLMVLRGAAVDSSLRTWILAIDDRKRHDCAGEQRRRGAHPRLALGHRTEEKNAAATAREREGDKVAEGKTIILDAPFDTRRAC